MLLDFSHRDLSIFEKLLSENNINEVTDVLLNKIGVHIEQIKIDDSKQTVSNLKFSQAFNELYKENCVGMRLPHWSPEVIVKIQIPDKNSKMTAPYLYVESRYGCIPWKETNIELFSNKWQVVY